MEIAGGVLKLAREVNETAMRRDLDTIASMPNGAISRRERERLLVRKAVAHLPQDSRLIVFMKFWEGETIGEIAEMMNLTFDSVRVTLLIALAYLEKQLAPYVLDPDFFTKGDVTAV